MSTTSGSLTDQDHAKMDAFLGRVLEAHKSGAITKEQAVTGLAHVMAALDIKNAPEAVMWFEQNGVEFFKDN